MSQRSLTHGTILESRAAQWGVRTGAAVLLLGAMSVAVPLLGITILSPSQLIDRFLAWNHTFPTLLGAADPAIHRSSPSMSLDALFTVIVWAGNLFIIVGIPAIFVATWRERSARCRRVSSEDNEGDT